METQSRSTLGVIVAVIAGVFLLLFLILLAWSHLQATQPSSSHARLVPALRVGGNRVGVAPPSSFPLRAWTRFSTPKAPIRASGLLPIARYWWKHPTLRQRCGDPITPVIRHIQKFRKGCRIVANTWLGIYYPSAPAAPVATPRPTAKPAPLPTTAPVSSVPSTTCSSDGTGCRVAYLALLNRLRANVSVAPLTLDMTQSLGTGTCVGSQGHSAAMLASGTIWHVNASYPAASFPTNLCVPYSNGAENVGYAGGDAWSAIQTITNLMMAEPHDPSYCASTYNHACDILNPKFTKVGIGIAGSSAAFFFTNDFTG